ncbi:hypothetical protein [Psychroserpens luteus]|uniref:YokE-like PH domain-containing protein n=1 Tax=Psychroserpens luteus TaxID=1434066 RepID=A0ABW6A1A5_9FLAO|nr:hypothetical protein [Psychroserpens luteus]
MNDLYYPLIIALVIYILLSALNSKKKQKKIDNAIKSLESDYEYQFKISGRVHFSKLHILLECYLTVLYSENNILIYGYDNYSHRQTKFLFYTDKNNALIEDINIPKYSILDIEIIENDKIFINGDDNSIITLRYINYGKEKPQLKEPKFVELLKKLNKATLLST